MTSLSCRCYAKPYHNDFADWDVLTAVSPLLPCAVLGVCRQLPQRFRRYFSKQSALRDKISREDFRQNGIHTHDADHNHYTKNVDNDDDGNGQRWICWWSDDDDVFFGSVHVPDEELHTGPSARPPSIWKHFNCPQRFSLSDFSAHPCSQA